jgi:hypothetical protein
MLKLLTILNFIFILGCSRQQEKWETPWNKHQDEFKEIVGLVKAGKLKVVYGRMGFAIPDSFDLQTTCGQLVFRETDFTYDSSYSILFRMDLDTIAVLRADPMIVYTDNKKRISEYESDAERVRKIEKNWYFITR